MPKPLDTNEWSFRAVVHALPQLLKQAESGLCRCELCYFLSQFQTERGYEGKANTEKREGFYVLGQLSQSPEIN